MSEQNDKLSEKIAEAPLIELHRQRFKPDHKGFSSCIQCEKDAVKRQRAADHKYYLTKAREAVEGAGLTDEEIVDIGLSTPLSNELFWASVGKRLVQAQLQAILKALGGE